MGTHRFSSEAVTSSMREAAAHWVRCRETGMTDAEENQFAEWITEDPRHQIALNDATDAWVRLDQLCKLKSAKVSINADALAPAGFNRDLPSDRKRWPSWIPATLAAAAALAVGFILWSRSAQFNFKETVVTEVGGQRTLDLPDGSVIHLNTDSQVAVGYTDSERHIQLLRGEAHFTVARNSQRPFIVSADRVSVRAVGTAFNVRLDEAKVEVLVTEGKVRVDDKTSGATLLARNDPVNKPAEAPVLFAGQRAIVHLSMQPEPVAISALQEREVVRALSWQEKRLEFVSTPLSEVVAEFNRYNTHKLVIADPRLAELRFGGIFRPDAADTAVRMLEANFDVVAERTESATILRLAAR